MYTEDMLTVKEWAEKAGLHLYNYDGFVHMYQKLANEENVDLSTNIANRMRNAGELLCTRRAFQAGLYRCTIQFLGINEYETMLEVIPDFVESNLTISISMFGAYNKKIEKSDVKTLLKQIKLKLKAREKSIELNDVTDEIQLESFDKTRIDAKRLEKLKEYGSTVEECEVKLFNEIVSELENLLTHKNVKLSKKLDEKIGLLTSLLFQTARSKSKEPQENEYMYVNIPGVQKEPFVQPFRIIDDSIPKEERIGFMERLENFVK